MLFTQRRRFWGWPIGDNETQQESINLQLADDQRFDPTATGVLVQDHILRK